MASRMVAGIHDLFYGGPATNDKTGVGAGVSTYLGSTGPEGITLTIEHNYQDITGDALGAETTIDAVYQGGNCTLSFVLQELNDFDNSLSVRQYLSPFRETTFNNANYHNEVGVVGNLMSEYHGILTAQPRANTPAYGASAGAPTAREFKGVHIGPTTEFLDNRPNFVPSVFRCLPFDGSAALDGSGPTVWWRWVANNALTAPSTDAVF